MKKSLLSALGISVMIVSASRCAYPLCFAAALLIHEAGHLFFAFVLRARVGRVGAGFLRLCITYDASNIGYLREALVCAGGIIFNLVSALLSLPLAGTDAVIFFRVCSLSLAAMNALPVRILDGGGILSCAANGLFLPDRAERICRFVSFVFVIFIWLASVYAQLRLGANLTLFLLSLYLIIDSAFPV